MRSLPEHHLPRPRLVERCAGAKVVVVEAAGGYGKSTFGIELVESWRVVGIDVQLEHGDVPAALFASRLLAAAGRAGFTGAVAAAKEAGEDAVGAVDALAAALAGEDCAFVVDDLHEARPDACALVDRLAERLERHQRLVVLARRLPEGGSRLRRAEYLQLGASDLALDADETLQLCRAGFGLDIDAEGARSLVRATGGWTAATVLAAARLARTGESVGAVVSGAGRPDDSAGALAAILDEALVGLGREAHPLLAQIARIPLLDADVVDTATGVDGFFARALAAGVPLTPSGAPWWDLPGPVRDHLATLAPADRAVMRRAAGAYVRRGERGRAVQLLLATGEPDEAADVLATTPPESADSFDALELQAVVEQLPEGVVEQHPGVLLLVGRSCYVTGRLTRAVALFEQALAIAERTGDARLGRAARIELANETARQLDKPAAAAAARRILGEADSSELHVRARAYQVLAEALCWQRDEAGRRDEAALAEAERCFAEASALYRALNMRYQMASMFHYWAISIEFAEGKAERALQRLEEAAAMVADRPWRLGYALCFRAWVAADLGMDDLCRSTAEELSRLGDQLDAAVFRAHAHWKLAILSSYRGDADATVEHLRLVERHRGSWWGHASGDFLAEAADLADRAGHSALAWEYLERAKAEPKDAGNLIALSEAAMEARHGDPARAEEHLRAAAGRVDPRERWRVTLLGAYAKLRRGDDAAAGSMAARAFEEAARLGQPGVPLVRERAVAEQLLGLAAETGQPAARQLRAATVPHHLALLGRFELTAAGRPVTVPPGKETQLLKLVAVRGGRAHAEEAMEDLWPAADRDAGRNRLRTVLNRLRSTAGDIVRREGEMLVLDRSIRVDVDDFFGEGRRALALAATDPLLAAGLARGAVARCRGELLPDDPYESWTQQPREQVRALMLDLLDLIAAEAARRGDLDGLRQAVVRTIEFAPYDDRRYLRAASIFLEQGRRGEALAVVRRAQAALAQIGLDAPDHLLELEELIVG